MEFNITNVSFFPAFSPGRNGKHDHDNNAFDRE